MEYAIGVVVLVFILFVLWIKLVNIKTNAMINGIKKNDPVHIFVENERVTGTFIKTLHRKDSEWVIQVNDKLLIVDRKNVYPVLHYKYGS